MNGGLSVEFAFRWGRARLTLQWFFQDLFMSDFELGYFAFEKSNEIDELSPLFFRFEQLLFQFRAFIVQDKALLNWRGDV